MPRLTAVVLVIALPLFVATSISSQVRKDQRPVLWKAFEKALVKNEEMLYNLSDAFFPPGSLDDGQNSVSVAVLVGVTVDSVNNTYIDSGYPGLCCSTNMGYCSAWVNCRDIQLVLEQPKTNSGTSQISNLLAGPDISMVLTAFDPAFYYLMKKLSDEVLDFISVLAFQETIMINFHVDNLEVMPSDNELNASLSAVLTWVSSYTISLSRIIKVL